MNAPRQQPPDDELVVVLAMPPAVRQLVVNGVQNQLILLRRNRKHVPPQAVRFVRQLVSLAGQGCSPPLSPEDLDHSEEVQPLMVNRGEAGRRIGVSESTVRRLVRDQQLPEVKIGRLSFIRVTDINDYVAALPTEPPTAQEVEES